MAILFGTKSGVIGDTQQGFDLRAFMEKALAEQCRRQHYEQEGFIGGEVVSCGRDDDSEWFSVEYENGECWKYRFIDGGAEMMEKEKIK